MRFVPAQPVYVTRKFPPSVGGMETLAAGVWRSVVQIRPDAQLIAHGGSNAALVWWLPVAVLRVLLLILRGRAEVVLAGDALTYAVLWPLLKLFRVPSATMVMGLDVTYESAVYRALVRPTLRAAPHVLAVSAATATQAIAAGVRSERVTVVRLGVATPPAPARSREQARAQVRSQLGLPADAVLLVTVGRLVRRKGALWFAEQVLPALPADVHYVLAGSGPDEGALRALAADRVHLLGRISDADREDLLRAADLFVQPNVVVPGDMEGFGMVIVEAAMRGLVVLAADLEGIKDAVVAGETGLLVTAEDPAAWVAALLPLVADPGALVATGKRFQEAARTRYSEQQMGTAVCEALGLSGSSRG